MNDEGIDYGTVYGTARAVRPSAALNRTLYTDLQGASKKYKQSPIDRSSRVVNVKVKVGATHRELKYFQLTTDTLLDDVLVDVFDRCQRKRLRGYYKLAHTS